MAASTPAPPDLATVQWPDRPWWMVMPGQDQWVRLLRRDVTLFSRILPRQPTTDEAQALVEYMAAKERYNAAGWHLGPPIFAATMLVLRRTAFGARTMAFWLSKPWINQQEWFMRQSLTGRIFTISAGVALTAQTALITVLSPVGQFSAAMAAARDPRLRQLNLETRERLMKTASQHGGFRPAPGQPAQQQARTGAEPAGGAETAQLERITKEKGEVSQNLYKLVDALNELDRRISNSEGGAADAQMKAGRQVVAQQIDREAQRYYALAEREKEIRQSLGLPPPEQDAVENAVEVAMASGSAQDSGASDLPLSQGSTNWGTASGYGSRSGSPIPPSSSSSEDDWDPLEEHDDASPVAPSERGRPTASTPARSGGGSAWDRLRQQARGRAGEEPPSSRWGASPPTSAPQDRGQVGAQGAYGSREDGKSTSKDQAQKEFDAMIERERRGQNEEDSRRW